MLKIINPNPSSTGELGSDNIDLRFTNTLNACFLEDYLKTQFISPHPDGCILIYMGLSHGFKSSWMLSFRRKAIDNVNYLPYSKCEKTAKSSVDFKTGQVLCTEFG